MKPNEYLKEILEQQTFSNDAQELNDLRDRRNEIDKKLRSHFSKSSPSIKWAGSMAKGTLICESYDGDMTCYFPEDEKEAGETLEAIYDEVESALSEGYRVQRKASALRVFDKDDWAEDLQIDVVPGRYTDDEKSDVFLHRTTDEKERLKTNLQTHIDHIKDSGVVDAIRLLKLWKVRHGLPEAKTFVLELLVVKLLKKNKNLGLSDQLEHVWTELRDKADELSVEDPANSNNDLKSILDTCRYSLSAAAMVALSLVESKGWESLFGEVESEKEEDSDRAEDLKVAVANVVTQTKPWCSK